MGENKDNSMAKIVSLAKRRGFIFPSSEIYGGFSSCYDYGSLGVELKNNIKREWWKTMVWTRGDVVGLDSAILMSPKVWEASGHLSAGFADELVECKMCHKRFRKDHPGGSKCPECRGDLMHPRKFNLMMKTYAGVTEEDSNIAYLRAETAQGIYVNFKNVLDSMRIKIPFGIAQIGKAFRNEITPGNFTFRTREFEQMEMQWFCRPKSEKPATGSQQSAISRKRKVLSGEGRSPEAWFGYWKKERLGWYTRLGINSKNIRFRAHKKNELAHYAKAAEDIEYQYPFGWAELEGIHDRGQWDLSNHAKYSGEDLSYFEETGNRYIPNIIETSAGADRSTLVFLLDAYHEEDAGEGRRVVLKFHSRIAPVKVAVLPLVKNKPKLVRYARKIYEDLKSEFPAMYDETGSIGRRYRRQDEIGTPYAVTIDFDSLKWYTVTLRDRDTMKQTRHKVEELKDLLQEKLEER